MSTDDNTIWCICPARPNLTMKRKGNRLSVSGKRRSMEYWIVLFSRAASIEADSKYDWADSAEQVHRSVDAKRRKLGLPVLRNLTLVLRVKAFSDESHDSILVSVNGVGKR